MRYLILILALMFAVPAFAQDNQTASQQLNAEIAKMSDAEKEKALKSIKAGESPSAAQAREWIDIGNGLGEGLAATAQKLGVVANDFAKSPVGQMAMFLIIWNYMGDDITGWICGFGWLIITLPFWIYNFRKTFGVFNEKGKFLYYDKEMFNDRGQYGAIIAVYFLALAVMLFVGIVFIA